MGLYGWLNDQEFFRCSVIGSDEELNEIFQEVRELMPEWYVEERVTFHKSFWGKKSTDISYTVYQRQGDSTEVRIQMSATRKKELLNLFCGLAMGYHKAKQDEKNT